MQQFNSTLQNIFSVYLTQCIRATEPERFDLYERLGIVNLVFQ